MPFQPISVCPRPNQLIATEGSAFHYTLFKSTVAFYRSSLISLDLQTVYEILSLEIKSHRRTVSTGDLVYISEKGHSSVWSTVMCLWLCVIRKYDAHVQLQVFVEVMVPWGWIHSEAVKSTGCFFSEGPGSVPRTHMVLATFCNCTSMGFKALWHICIPNIHTCSCRQNTLIHRKQK